MSNAFNATYELSLQLNSGSIRNINQQISSGLSGINVPVSVGVAPEARTALAGLQGQMNGVNQTLSTFYTASQAANNALRSTGSAAKAAGNEMASFDQQLQRSTQNFTAFSLAAGTIGTVALAFRSALTEAANFERQMVRLTQVSHQGQASVAEVSSEITRLSTNFGVSSRSLADVSIKLQQAGFSAKEMKFALEAISKADLAPNLGGVQKAGEALLLLRSQFGATAEEYERRLSSINAVSSTFGVSSEDIVSAVQKTGGAFRAAGGNLEELVALFATVKSTTRESSDSIASGLRTILVRLERPTTIENLRQLGVQLQHTKQDAERLGDTKLDGQFVGPLEAVKRLSQALSGLRSTDSRFSALAEELGGFREINKVIPVLQEQKKLQEALNVATAGGVGISDSAGKAQNSLTVQVVKLKEGFLSLGRTILENSAFRAMLNDILSVTGAVIRMADAFKPLLPIISAIAALKIGQAVAQVGVGLAGKVSRFSTGGLVPGQGEGDTVPAYLTPREFVINKRAAEGLGLTSLQYMNQTGRLPAGTRGYATGGDVGGPEDSEARLRLLREYQDRKLAGYGIAGRWSEAVLSKKLAEAGPQVFSESASIAQTSRSEAIPTKVKGVSSDGNTVKGTFGEIREKLAGQGVSYEGVGHMVENLIRANGQMENSAALLVKLKDALGGVGKQIESVLVTSEGYGKKVTGKGSATPSLLTPAQEALLTPEVVKNAKLIARNPKYSGYVETLGGREEAESVINNHLISSAQSYDLASKTPFDAYIRHPQKGIPGALRSAATSLSRKHATENEYVTDKREVAPSVLELADELSAKKEAALRAQKAEAAAQKIHARIQQERQEDAGAESRYVTVQQSADAPPPPRRSLRDAARQGSRSRTASRYPLTVFDDGIINGESYGRDATPPHFRNNAIRVGSQPQDHRLTVSNVTPLDIYDANHYEEGQYQQRVLAEAASAENSRRGEAQQQFPQTVRLGAQRYGIGEANAERQRRQQSRRGSILDPDGGLLEKAVERSQGKDVYSEKLRKQKLERALAAKQLTPADALVDGQDLVSPLDEYHDLVGQGLIGLKPSGDANRGVNANVDAKRQRQGVRNKGFVSRYETDDEVLEKLFSQRASNQQSRSSARPASFHAAGRRIDLDDTFDLRSPEDDRRNLAVDKQRLDRQQRRKFRGKSDNFRNVAFDLIPDAPPTATLLDARGIPIYPLAIPLGGSPSNTPTPTEPKATKAAAQAASLLEENAKDRRSRLYTGAGFAALAISSYGLNHLNEQAGTAEEAVAGNTQGRFATTKGVSGGLQGALTFGAAGASFGPYGAALGAAAGGLYGFVSSLKEAESEIRKVQIAGAVTELSGHLKVIATVGQDASAATNAGVVSSQATIKANRDKENYETAAPYGGIFGIDADKFHTLTANRRREDAAANLGGNLSSLQRLTDDAAKSNPGLSATQIFDKVTNANKANQGIVQEAAVGSQRSPEEFRKEQIKRVGSDILTRERDKSSVTGAASDNRNIYAFGRLTTALELASAGLTDLNAKASSLGNVFEGKVGATPVSTGPGLRLGNPDQNEFGRNVRGVTAQFGESGQHLASAASGANAIESVLPVVLTKVLGQHPNVDAAGFASHTRAGVLEALGYVGPDAEKHLPDQTRAALNSAVGQIGRRPEEEIRAGVQLDATGFSKSITKPHSGPIEEAFNNNSRLLEKSANDFINVLVQATQRASVIRQSQDKQVQLELASVRQSVAFRTQEAGNPNQALDLIPLKVLQQPLQERQERLTGFGGAAANDPTAIGRRLSQIRGQIGTATQSQQDIFRSEGKSPNFDKAAGNLVKLEDASARLFEALTHLTNGTEQGAAAQEKLAHINEDRDGRRGLVRSYVFGSEEENLKTDRGLNIANAAHERGDDLRGFSKEDQQLAISALDKAGKTKLSGFSGQPIANDLAQQLLDGLAGKGKLDAGNAKEEVALKADVEAKNRAAIEAEKVKQEHQEATNGLIGKVIGDQNAVFLNRLEQILTKDKVVDRSVELEQVRNQQAGNKRLETQKGVLARSGIVDDKQLGVAQDLSDDVSVVAKNAVLTDRLSNQAFQASQRIRKGGTGLDFGSSASYVNANLLGPGGSLSGETVQKAASYTSKNLTEFTAEEQTAINLKFAEVHAKRLRERNNEHPLTPLKAGQETNDFVQESYIQSIGGVASQRNAKTNEAGADATKRLRDTKQIDVEALKRDAVAHPDEVTKALSDFKGTTFSKLALDTQTAAAKIDLLSGSIVRLNGVLDGKKAAADGPVPEHRASGGTIGQHPGRASGTDTVPAWLSPGEFVVNAQDAKEHVALLHQINNGQARKLRMGGAVYLADGGDVDEEARTQEGIKVQQQVNAGQGAGVNRGFLPEAADPALQRLAGVAPDINNGLAIQRGNDLFAPKAARQGAAGGQGNNSDDILRRLAYANPTGAAGQQRLDDQLRQKLNKQANAILKKEGESARFTEFVQAGKVQLGNRLLNNYTSGQANDLQRRQRLAHTGNAFAAFGVGRPGLESQQSSASAAFATQGRFDKKTLLELSADSVSLVRDAREKQLRNQYVPTEPATAPAQGFATGGYVGTGSGSGDDVAAYLSRGEFVLNPHAVNMIGAGQLDRVNKFASGGPVGLAQAGSAATGVSASGGSAAAGGDNVELSRAMASFSASASGLGTALSLFGGHATHLADALSKFPSAVKVENGGRIEVIINGAEALARLSDGLKDYVVEQAEAAVKKMFKEKLPDA